MYGASPFDSFTCREIHTTVPPITYQQRESLRRIADGPFSYRMCMYSGQVHTLTHVPGPLPLDMPSAVYIRSIAS